MKKYWLEITVFICGAIVMVFELVGSRILGPYLGNSIYVWTSLIGIILGSLSLGYYWGGKLADKKTEIKTLATIIFLAGALIIVNYLIKDNILRYFSNLKLDNRLLAVIISLIIFAPASILLGIISPYAVKLKLQNLSTSGQAVGQLYALSTLGSIFGTFAAGFWLIPQLGTNNIVLSLGLILIILSIIIYSKNLLKSKVASLIFILVLFGLQNLALINPLVKEIDTQYNHVRIFASRLEAEKDKPIIALQTSAYGFQSIMYADDHIELAAPYTRYYRLIEHFNPDFKKALMIGGGAYSFPKYFLKHYPEAQIDVIEIDPGLTALAKKYFYLTNHPNLKIFHEDGRWFINQNQTKYDVIIGDAFGGFFDLPYQLTTREFITKQYETLNEEGMVIVNIISGINGDKGEFIRAEIATYKEKFPQVYIFPVSAPEDPGVTQNIILVALKSKTPANFSSANPEIQSYLNNLWTKNIDLDKPILTDNYAPVEHYINKLF